MERSSIAYTWADAEAVDIECDQQSPVAASFKDYLNLLRIEANDVFVLETVASLRPIQL